MSTDETTPVPPLSTFRFTGIEIDRWAYTSGIHKVTLGKDCPWEMNLRAFKPRMRRAAALRGLVVRCWDDKDGNLYVQFRADRNDWPKQYAVYPTE